MGESRPNIILLLTDNQRIDQVGCHAGNLCRTPTLDWIGQGGVVMENLRTTSPVCSPARASLFTGYDPHEAGVPSVHNSWPGQVAAGSAKGGLKRPLISRYMREAGYECLYAGKWHVGDDNLPGAWDGYAGTRTDFQDYSQWCLEQGLPDGFIFNDPVRSKPYRFKEPPHMTLPTPGVLDIPEWAEINRWMLNKAESLYRQRSGQKPLFMVFSTYGVHPPLQVPQKFFDLYDPAKIAEPPNFGPNEPSHEPETLRQSYFRREFEHYGKTFNDAWRKSIAVSHGYATYIDSLFGEFLTRLDQDGLLEDSLIMMVSDHGDMLGQHGLVAKFCPYEENLRVPWLMRWPGKIKPGTRCKADSTMMDVPATLLAAAGIDPESLGLQGRNALDENGSFRGLPEGRDCFSGFTRPEDWSTWHPTCDWRLIFRRPWKYVLYQNGEEELFQLADDPGERDNLARRRDTLPLRRELKAVLKDQADMVGDPFFG